jgi:Mg2+/Co2+ transporter CorB
MIPRNEIVGINLNDDIEQITDLITHTQYTRLPVFEDSIDNVVGIVHLRNVMPLLKRGALTHADLRSVAREPYFIPEGTSLNRQLLNFQRESRRTGLVVDEYGDIQGLVALEDILEEIVGEFTTDPGAVSKDITPQEDGSYLIDCAAYIRDLNRAMHIELPTGGPKTLNGLILEHMQDIPEAGTSLLLAGYPIEIVQTKDNAVKIARIDPKQRRAHTG